MPAVVARRTRYDMPAWAEKTLGPNPGPADFDRLQTHKEARKIASGTDPDDIDDPDVRDQYLALEQERFARDGDDDSSGGGRDTSGARDGSVVNAPPPARRSLRSAVGADAGGMFGAVGVDDAAGLLLGLVAYAVTVSAFRDPVSATNGVRRWFAAKFFNQTTGGGVGPLTSTGQDPAVLQGLLQTAVTTTNATPKQAVPVTTIGGLLRSGLPASAFPAPKPPAPAGAGG